MKRSWQTFRLMHISLQMSELPDRLLSIIRDPKGERFISKVKYQPSAKKMVKPKQVITFVLLLERSDGFLLCGVDAHRAEDRASGFYLGACSQGKFRGLSSECSSEHYSPQSVFLFFVYNSAIAVAIFKLLTTFFHSNPTYARGRSLQHESSGFSGEP